MDPADALDIVRRAYAKQVAHAADADARLETALAVTPREAFIGQGPWDLMRLGVGYVATPDADPVYLYQDTPVAILRDKGLNNGQPSFLARLIGLCDLEDGDVAVHIGTGTGYYTALMSQMVGERGRVVGLEIDADLAARAQRLLADRRNATIRQADGWTHRLDPADAILVNAGTPAFAATWLDALEPGGRLVVPLAVSSLDPAGREMTKGLIFRIVRDADGYAAAATLHTMIFPCIGSSDPAAEDALHAALQGGGARKVTRLRREDGIRDDRCWLRGRGWALTFD